MFEEIIKQNHIKTTMVLVLYTIIFIFVGILGDIVRINASSFGGAFFALITFRIFPLITIIMGCAAFVIMLYSVSNFNRIMLSGSEYREIDKFNAINKQEKELVQILDEVLRQSNTPFKPKLYIMNAPYMNAFASGWNSENSLIAVTTALLNSLQRDEIKAVVAHELSHIKHGDIRLTLCVGILSNVMVLAVNFISMAFFGSHRNQGASLARNILMILTFILPLITLVLQLFLSRSREYMADSGAAYIMKDNRPMIRALQKISGNYQQYDFRDIDNNPTRQAAYIFSTAEMLSTHPSIENRIRALMGK